MTQFDASRDERCLRVITTFEERGIPLKRATPADERYAFEDSGKGAFHSFTRGEESIDCLVEWDDDHHQINVIYHWRQNIRSSISLRYDSRRAGLWTINKMETPPRLREMSPEQKLLSLFVDCNSVDGLNDEQAYRAMTEWATLLLGE